MAIGWIIRRIREVVAIAPPGVYITPAIAVPNITPANALHADDAMGDLFGIRVPKSGIIQSATFYDVDDEGSQVDLVLTRARFTGAASDAAFSMLDDDLLTVIIQLNFTTFFDMVNGQVSSIENIGKAYRVPPEKKGSKMGVIYAQAIARGTPNIAAGQ